MRKYFVHLVFLIIGLTFIQTVTKEEVTVDIRVPEEVTAGTEFQVTILLDKGNLQSFSRFQQKIPYGLKASPGINANADFTFKDNRVRLIWLHLPEENMFEVTYSIAVNERLKGDFNIGGTFSYIENNERYTVEFPVKTIKINPSPNIDPSLIVDIDDYQNSMYHDIRPEGDDRRIICIREKADLTDSGNEIIVKLFVNKENKNRFAKIQENIPSGYTAVPMQRGGGIFTQKGTIIKFLWMNLPDEKDFVVSYKLIPQNGASISSLGLKGTFSYMEGENTITLPIVERDIDVENITEIQLLEILASLKDEPQLAQVTETVQQQEIIPDEIETPTEVITEKTTNNTQQSHRWNKSYLLEPEEGIYYRVQIAAGHTPVNIRRYFKKYKIKEDIKTEMHDGWHKYSIGSFRVYKDARDYRVKIWNTTTIDDAFVSAYNEGTRITVQEALMVVNQKWYQ